MKNTKLDKRAQIIQVLPYDPLWPILFLQEAGLIKPLLKNNFSEIYHVGRASVPGVPAKPTIDITLEVKDIQKVDDLNPKMAELGYEVLGEYGIPGRRFFVKGE